MPVARIVLPLFPLLVASASTFVFAGCAEGEVSGQAADPSADPASPTAELVEPPFTIDDDSEGLLFVYFDEEGTHSVERLTEVPEASRADVRVDSLGLAPEDRLPAGFIYVADLRARGEGGAYAVRRMSREAFDTLVDRAGGHDGTPTPAAGGEVVLYGASWCGACRSAEGYLRGAGIPFIERDIERDEGAREEMVSKMSAAGLSPGGIPVIDFRGTIVQGFDRQALDRLVEAAGGL